MKINERKVHVLALFAIIFLVTACDASAQEDTDAGAPESAQQAESLASDEILLSETYVFPGFGFSIDYPSGWSAETRDTYTVISELESDLSNAFQDDSPPVEGVGLSLEQQTLAFMRSIGLAEEATLEDLFDLNKDFFEWQDSVEPVETEAFDAPALSVRTSNDEVWGYRLMGYTGDRAFLLQFSAPSEEILDDLMPTWEQMLASIQPVEE